jgi:hypothetical protein
MDFMRIVSRLMARRVRSLSSPCLREQKRGIRGIGCVCISVSVHMRN